MLGHGSPHGSGDFFRVKVQIGGQAGQIQMGPAIGRLEVKDFTGQGTTGDQQNTALAGLKREALFGELLI